MPKIREIEELVALSHLLGSNPAYIQGGGGNTSIKTDDGHMLVKASGSALKQMSVNSGYVCIDPIKVREILEQSHCDDNAYAKLLLDECNGNERRPSMETGFHAVLKRVVAHSHSVYLNVLTCSGEGPQLAQELFPDACWISYESPGLALSRSIHLQPNYEVYLLQNHGVIVTGNSTYDVFTKHAQLNEQARSHFNLTDEFLAVPTSCSDLAGIQSNVLFPDQAIYTSSRDNSPQTRASQETTAACHYILKSLKSNSLTPNFLSTDDINFLLDMDIEKDRRAIAI